MGGFGLGQDSGDYVVKCSGLHGLTLFFHNKRLIFLGCLGYDDEGDGFGSNKILILVKYKIKF